MAKRDYVHCAVHKNLVEEINRVLIECERLGLFINKKWASAIVAEKSKNHKMKQPELVEFLKKMRGVLVNEKA